MKFPELVLFEGWHSFFPDRVEPQWRAMATDLRQQLVRQILPEFLLKQRWFAGKSGQIDKVEFERYDLWPERKEWLLASLRVWLSGSTEAQSYALPLALAWGEADEDPSNPLLPYTLAKVRTGVQTGLLYDAYADERFCQNLIATIAHGGQIPLGQGRLHAFATPVAAETLSARRLTLDSSNTSIAIGDRLLMKAYRRLQIGVNPELEMGRFLTESGFRNIAPLAGALEYQSDNGERTTLLLLQGFIANQGDAWRYTQDYLKRFLHDYLQQPETVQKVSDEIHNLYRIFATTLGRRTGELHRTLAQATGDPAFDPEPITATDLAGWFNRIREEAIATFERLAQRRASLSEAARSATDRLLAERDLLLACLEQPGPVDSEAVKIRYHGDYHLGQVLVAKNDVILIDFEGEPSRTLEERRGKHSPLRDVVGILRSFNYAAHAALRPFTADTRLLAPCIDDWEQRTRAAFLDGYATATRDHRGLNSASAQAALLLKAFTLEKACYELRYELDNRPDWVDIPLDGLCELLPLPSET